MKQTTKVSEAKQLLVATGKSSRLDAIRKKVALSINTVDLEKQQPLFIAGLNQQTNEALRQANSMIQKRMNHIMAAYSAGKKNTYFKIKYGIDPDKIEELGIQEIFNLIELDSNLIKNFQLVKRLYLNGTSPVNHAS